MNRLAFPCYFVLLFCAAKEGFAGGGLAPDTKIALFAVFVPYTIIVLFGLFSMAYSGGARFLSQIWRR